MEFVALGVWAGTACFGLYLLVVWLSHGGLRQQATRITVFPAVTPQQKAALEAQEGGPAAGNPPLARLAKCTAGRRRGSGQEGAGAEVQRADRDLRGGDRGQ